MGDPTELFREALPSWANWLLLVSIPAANVVVGSVVLLCTQFFFRNRAEGEHWTERSRWNFTGQQFVATTAAVCSVLTVLFTVLVWHDLLHSSRRAALLLPAPPWILAVGACFALSAVGQLLLWRRRRWFWPDLGLGTYLQSRWGVGWISTLLLGVLVPVAAFGPATGWALLVVQPVALLYLVWIFRGGNITLGRVCGWIRPATPRLHRIAASAAAQSGHDLGRLWIDTSCFLNAYAMPAANAIVVTSSAEQRLRDDQLLALLLHEIGHLRDRPSSAQHRWAAMLFLAVVLLWQPILHHFGGGWLTLLLGLTMLATHWQALGVRQRETAADTHATEALDDAPGLYAETLEDISKGNLMPAVTRTNATTHPPLYDRMLLAGVTPSYPRPAPPRAIGGHVLLIMAIGIPLYCCELFAVKWLRGSIYVDAHHATWAVVATGGSAPSIGALGYHWRASRPEAAEAAWTIAANHSDLPEFPALLAQVWADRDPETARSWLAKAETALAALDNPDDWRREQVEAARQATRR